MLLLQEKQCFPSGTLWVVVIFISSVLSINLFSSETGLFVVGCRRDHQTVNLMLPTYSTYAYQPYWGIGRQQGVLGCSLQLAVGHPHGLDVASRSLRLGFLGRPLFCLPCGLGLSGDVASLACGLSQSGSYPAPSTFTFFLCTQLFCPLSEFTVADGVWPSDAKDLAQAAVDEDLHFLGGGNCSSLCLCSAQKDCLELLCTMNSQ